MEKELSNTAKMNHKLAAFMGLSAAVAGQDILDLFPKARVKRTQTQKDFDAIDDAKAKRELKNKKRLARS